MQKFKSLEELKQLSKSERKDYINKNGGFLKFECKRFTNKVDAPVEYAPLIPEGMTYVEGVISTGEMNMNGYKIDIKAWDQEAIDSYFNEWN